MKKLYSYILSLIVISLLGYNSIYSQSLRIVRTDVDSTRSDFVTATLIFGFDVYLQDIQRCKAVTFRMDYNQTDYVKFNEYRVDNFGMERGVVVIPLVNSAADLGSIYVGVGTSDTIGSYGYDNPMVIHLEFAVSQSVPNNNDVVFSFLNVNAIVNTDTGRTVVPITTEPITYNIHSFIDVWPGDTDNNGLVDEDDLTQVFLYDGYGSKTKQKRCFKRQNSSTLWYAQRVLTWDEKEATYADCDGNGDVTVSDLLVVVINLGKTHSKVSKPGNIVQKSSFSENKYGNSNSVYIPIYAEIGEKIIGFSGRIKWDNLLNNYKVLGIERSDLFPFESSMFYCKNNEDEKFSEIAFVSLDKSISVTGKICLGYIVCEPLNIGYNYQVQPIAEELYAATIYNNIVPFQTSSEVYEDNTDLTVDNIRIDNNNINITNIENKIESFDIYNELGTLVYSEQIKNYSNYYKPLNSLNLSSGVYFLAVKGTRKINIKQFVIVE